MFKRILSGILAGSILLSLAAPEIGAAAAERRAAQPRPAVTQKAEAGNYIIKFKDADKGKRELGKTARQPGKSFKRMTSHLRTYLSAEEAEKLKTDANITYIEKDSVVTKTAETGSSTADPIQAAAARQAGVTGAGVKVAVLDTGINAKASVLPVAGAVSFAAGEAAEGDASGHGTYVASLLAAADSGSSAGGVAPGVSLYSVKVLDENGSGTYSQVIEGIEWAVDNRMDVVLMSFAGSEPSAALAEAMQLAERQGVLLVGAAGNDGKAEVAYPARYSSVIAAAAVDGSDAHATFSNTGAEIELSAPGVNVAGLGADHTPSMQSGTSAAAAQIAGVAALTREAGSGLNSRQLRRILSRTAKDLGDPLLYGAGLVQAGAAVALAKQPDSDILSLGTNGQLSEAEIREIREKYNDELLALAAYYYAQLGVYLTPEQAALRDALADETAVQQTRGLSAEEKALVQRLTPIVLQKAEASGTTVTDAVYDPSAGLMQAATDPEPEFVFKTPEGSLPYKVKTDGYIDLTHGSSVQREVDVYLEGKNGMDLELVRTYNSMSANVTELSRKADAYNVWSSWNSATYCKGREYETSNDCIYTPQGVNMGSPATIAAGWTLNIPSVSGGYIEDIFYSASGTTGNYNFDTEKTSLGTKDENGKDEYKRYSETSFTTEDGTTYKFRENETQPYNYPYDNVRRILTNWSYYNDNNPTGIFVVDDKYTYTFYEKKNRISKANMFGDSIEYIVSQNNNRDWYQYTITDTVGRKVTLHVVRGVGVTSLSVRASDGTDVKSISYITSGYMVPETRINEDGNPEIIQVSQGQKLDSVYDGLAKKTLSKYTYYQPDQWMADANLEDDYTVALNGNGNVVLDVQKDGQGIEASAIDLKDRQTFKEIRYMMLKDATDETTGFTTRYTYQSYDANWKNYSDYLERERKRGTIRQYLDTQAITYKGYHPVTGISREYKTADGTVKQLNETVAVNLDGSREIWSYPKSGGPRGDFRLTITPVYRMGDRPVVRMVTDYGNYTTTLTKQYWINREHLLPLWEKQSKSDSSAYTGESGGTTYRFAADEITAYQYEYGNPKPYLIKHWSEGAAEEAKPADVKNFLWNGNTAVLPANLSSYATYSKYEYNSKGFVKREEDSLGNITERQYDGVFSQLSYVKKTSADGLKKNEESYTYDLRQETAIDGDGNPFTRNVASYGQLARKEEKQSYPKPETGETLTDTLVTEFTYNTGKKVPSTVTQAGSGSQYGNQPVTTTKNLEYDARDFHVTKQTIPVTLKENGGQTSLILGYEYNGRDQLVKQTYPDGSRAEYRYDTEGRMIQSKFIPPSGDLLQIRATDYMYDDAKRTVTQTQSDGSVSITSYTPYGEVESQKIRTRAYEKDQFNSAADYSGEKGKYGWSYIYVYENDDDGYREVDLSYNASTGKWYAGADTINGTDSWIGSYFLARRWTAPQSGKIRITGTAINGNPGAPGYAYLAKNPTTLWTGTGGRLWQNSSIPAGTPIQINQEIYVDKGDTLIFAGTSQSRNYPFTWSPTIEYLNPAPVAAGEKLVLLNKFDSTGTRIQESLPYGLEARKTTYTYGPQGVKTVTNALNQTVQYAYANTAFSSTSSHLQRTTKVVEPDGKETVTYADPYGRTTKVTEKTPGGKERTTAMLYNSLGQMTQRELTSPAAGDIPAKTETTNYAYDGAGRLAYLKDDLGQKFTYTYNRLGKNTAQYTNGEVQKQTTYNETGWPLSKTNAGSAAEKYEYTHTGLLAGYKDKAGQLYTYTYSPYGEQTRQSVKDAAGTTELYWKETVYDPTRRLVTEIKASDGENLAYQYDEWKHLTGQTAQGRTYQFTYDATDRMQKVIYPDNTEASYGYDALNRMTTVQYPGMQDVTYTYTTASNLNSYKINYGSTGMVQEKKTDGFKELTSEQHTAQGAATWNETFTYDGMGNIARIQKNGLTQNFAYDDLNRIVSESENGAQKAYTYDAKGNRIAMEGAPVPEAQGEQTYSYNAVNQLKTFNNGNGTEAGYTYYGDGLRASKTVGGDKTRYVYLNGKVIEELDAAGNVKARNIWGNELLWREGEGSPVPVETAETAAKGLASSSSVLPGEGGEVWRAFDGQDTLYGWHTNGQPTGWLAYEFPNPRVVNSYSLKPQNQCCGPARAPKSWTFEGFDGTNWVVLDSRSAISDWQMSVEKTFSFTNSTPYKKYRIKVTANNGDTYLVIGEMQLYSNGSPMIPVENAETAKKGLSTASTVLPSEGGEAWRAFDNQNTLYGWHTNWQPTGWLAYEFPVPKVVRSYTITSQNECCGPARAPKSWTFEGFNGTSWVVLDTQSNVTGWQLGKSKSFAFTNNTPYKKYRINVTANNGDSILVIGELRLGEARSGYYFYNGHGDVVAIKDASGNNINTYDYDIWGNVLSKTEGMNNPYRYTGEPQDDESGLIYLRARYYDPTIGRFISQDTVEGDLNNPLTLNLYTYVQNNPLKYNDPNGHWAHLVVGALIGGAIGGTGNALTQYLATGKIDWGEVAINTGSGAASGFIAATGVGLIGQIAINAGISGINYSLVAERADNFDWGSLAVNIGLGGLSGGIGGSGLFSKDIKELWFGAQYARYESGRLANAMLFRDAVSRAGVIASVRAVLGNAVSNYSSTKYSDLISQIQLALGIDVTGEFDEDTQSAFAALQKESGIEDNGIVTEDALKSISQYMGNITVTVPSPSSPNTVTGDVFGK